jgi:hypothetical protein
MWPVLSVIWRYAVGLGRRVSGDIASCVGHARFSHHRLLLQKALEVQHFSKIFGVLRVCVCVCGGGGGMSTP